MDTNETIDKSLLENPSSHPTNDIRIRFQIRKSILKNFQNSNYCLSVFLNFHLKLHEILDIIKPQDIVTLAHGGIKDSNQNIVAYSYYLLLSLTYITALTKEKFQEAISFFEDPKNIQLISFLSDEIDQLKSFLQYPISDPPNSFLQNFEDQSCSTNSLDLEPFYSSNLYDSDQKNQIRIASKKLLDSLSFNQESPLVFFPEATHNGSDFFILSSMAIIEPSKCFKLTQYLLSIFKHSHLNIFNVKQLSSKASEYFQEILSHFTPDYMMQEIHQTFPMERFPENLSGAIQENSTDTTSQVSSNEKIQAIEKIFETAAEYEENPELYLISSFLCNERQSNILIARALLIEYNYASDSSHFSKFSSLAASIFTRSSTTAKYAAVLHQWSNEFENVQLNLDDILSIGSCMWNHKYYQQLIEANNARTDYSMVILARGYTEQEKSSNPSLLCLKRFLNMINSNILCSSRIFVLE